MLEELCQTPLSWGHPVPSARTANMESVEFLGKDSVLCSQELSTSSGLEDLVLPEETHNLCLLPLIKTEGKTGLCCLWVWKLLMSQSIEDHLTGFPCCYLLPGLFRYQQFMLVCGRLFQSLTWDNPNTKKHEGLPTVVSISSHPHQCLKRAYWVGNLWFSNRMELK